MSKRFDEEFEAALAELVRVERAARPAPDEALMERVLADAAAMRPARAEAPPDRPGRPARWRAGWPSFLPRPATLAACGVACLLVGVGLGYGVDGRSEAALAAFGGLDGSLLAEMDAAGLSEFPL